jgi:hypothetical protein
LQFQRRCNSHRNLERETEINLHNARLLSEEWWRRGNGYVRIIPDTLYEDIFNSKKSYPFIRVHDFLILYSLSPNLLEKILICFNIKIGGFYG